MLTSLIPSHLSRLGTMARVVALFCVVHPLQAAPIVDEQHHLLWTHQSAPGTPPTLIQTSHTESGVSLSVSATAALSAFLSSDTSSDFALSPGQSVQLNVEGISFSTSDMAAYNQQLIFALTDSPDEDLYSSGGNSIAIFIDGGKGIRLGFKKGSANAWPWASNVIIPNTSLAGVVTGFNLTLTSDRYILVVHTNSVTNPTRTFEDSYSIGTGWNELGLIAQYRKGSATAGYGGVEVASITLQSIPEPSAAVMAGGGLLMALALKRYHHRTSQQ